MSPPPLSSPATGPAFGVARRWVRAAVDFALPPRCPACGVVVGDDRQLCYDCWGQVAFPGDDGCRQCALPLPPIHAEGAGDGIRCGACLTDPPPFAALASATHYGPVTRAIALRLKYGRRLGHARLMAGLMARPLARLVAADPDARPPLLVPVPLHRRRLWSRGFNQAALIAQWLAREQDTALGIDALRRHRATPSLRGLGRAARDRAVRGAFAVPADDASRLHGRHVILIDDVYASGATARAATRALTRAGAARVSLLCWARVVPEADGGDGTRAEIDFARLDSDMDRQ